MNEPVIDSSVILAIAKSERIGEMAVSLIDGGVMSTVNVSEVYAKLIDLRIAPAVVDPLLATLARIEPLTLSQALLASSLRNRHATQGCLSAIGVAWLWHWNWAGVPVPPIKRGLVLM